MRGTFRYSSFGTVQRRDVHVKSFGKLHNLRRDPKADRIDIRKRPVNPSFVARLAGRILVS